MATFILGVPERHESSPACPRRIKGTEAVDMVGLEKVTLVGWNGDTPRSLYLLVATTRVVVLPATPAKGVNKNGPQGSHRGLDTAPDRRNA
jgi:hypothetical protein